MGTLMVVVEAFMREGEGEMEGEEIEPGSGFVWEWGWRRTLGLRLALLDPPEIDEESLSAKKPSRFEA